MTFREWYVARHGALPGRRAGVHITTTMEELCDAVIDYVDEALNEKNARGEIELRALSFRLALDFAKGNLNQVDVLTKAREIYQFISGDDAKKDG